jgi:hypothetical protein
VGSYTDEEELDCFFDTTPERSQGWHEPKSIPPQVEEVRPYVEGVAKNPVAKLCGPHGPAGGTKLIQIEALLLEVRQVLTAKRLDETLARPAASAEPPSAYRTGPRCPAPRAGDDTDPRRVQTRAGEAEGSEPEGYCTRCVA